MKILLFIDSLGSGGAQRQLISLAKMLKEESFDVEVLCYYKFDFFAQELINNKIKIHWVLVKNPIMRILTIRRFIRSGNYNAVISFLDTPDLLNCISAIGNHDWKVITSERSSKDFFLKTAKGKIYAWFRRFSDYIVCNSENAKLMWLENYPNYSRKLNVIYNAITLPNVSVDYTPLLNGKVHLVVAASFQKLKNPILLVEAINLLSKEEKERLLIRWYGRINTSFDEGTIEYDKTKDLIKKYNLSEVITLNDETSDIHNLMYKADIVGLFSEYEGLPNAICEAMMLSKPILMTKVSDYNKLVSIKNGFLCEEISVDGIYKSIKGMLYLNADEFSSLGNNSKDIAHNLFDKKSILSSWLNLIR